MAETIVTGRKYRVCVDASNDTWNVVSFWGKASDVELDDGSDLQTFIDNINTKITGILSGTLSDSTTTAPTSKLLKDQINVLNTNFNNSVTTIFNKLKDYGYTPSSTQLADVTTAITNMYNGRYTAGQDNIKNATLSSSNFTGSVASNKYNVKSSKAGYVTNGATVHSIDVQTVTKTIGVGGSYTIPAGYHSGSGKVSFSATAGTATATSTAATGSVTVNLGATGYYNKVTINQTNAYNAGSSAGKAAAIKSLGSGTSFTVTSYTGYKNFTVSNFIVEPENIAEWKHGDDHMNGDWHFGSGGSLTLTKSYNASTGVLTAYTTMTTFKTINGNPSERGSTTGKVKAYLWIKS